jgi:hypothetical protein
MMIITDDRPDAITKARMFETLLKPCVSEVKVITTMNVSREVMNINKNTILVTIHRARGYVNPIGDSVSIRSVITEIAASRREQGIALRGIILFGSPYLDSEFQVPPAFVMKTFSESGASIAAAAERLQQEK